MQYLNLLVTDLDKPEFTGEDTLNRGTWLCLIALCVKVENGGLIQGCRHWKNRMWEQTAKVTLSEVTTPSELWTWEGDDLRVWNYPSSKETQVKAGRSGGKNGGRPSKENPPSSPTVNPSQNPPLNPTQNPKGMEGKGMEGKKKEVEGGKAATTTASTPPAFSPPISGSAPCSLEQALSHANAFSQGNSEMLVIEEQWVREWYSFRSRDNWVRIKGEHQIPIQDWWQDLLIWSRNERDRNPNRFASKTSPGAEKKEKGAAPGDEPPVGWEAAWSAMSDEPPPSEWLHVEGSRQLEIRKYLAA